MCAYRMKYDFETLVDRRRAGALKWDLMRQAQPNAPEDAVPLSVADMEFVIAPEIRAALHHPRLFRGAGRIP